MANYLIMGGKTCLCSGIGNDIQSDATSTPIGGNIESKSTVVLAIQKIIWCTFTSHILKQDCNPKLRECGSRKRGGSEMPRGMGRDYRFKKLPSGMLQSCQWNVKQIKPRVIITFNPLMSLPHSHFIKLEEVIYCSGNELHMLIIHCCYRAMYCYHGAEGNCIALDGIQSESTH